MNAPVFSTANAQIFAGFLLTFTEEVINALMIRLQNLYSAFDGTLLKKISLMVEETLRHPGKQLADDHLLWAYIGAVLVFGIPGLTALFRMLLTGIRLDKASFPRRKEGTNAAAANFRGAVCSYLRSISKTLLEGIVLLCVATVLTTVAYLFTKIAWYSYQAGPVGQYYAVHFPHRAQLMEMVLGLDLFLFPTMLTGIACAAGLVFSACCRIFYISRYLYLPRGGVGKTILFALPLNLLAAAAVRTVFPIPHWAAAYAAALLPTLLVFPYCFRFTNRLLPEIGMVLTFWKRKRKSPLHVIFLKYLNSGKKTMEFDPLNGKFTGKQFPADDDIDTHGQFLSRGGHTFILYRYGHDLFFQVDDRELPVDTDMSAQWRQTGRFINRFELYRNEKRLFRLAWSTFPRFAFTAPAVAFFDQFEGILKNRSTYENTFMVETEC